MSAQRPAKEDSGLVACHCRQQSICLPAGPTGQDNCGSSMACCAGTCVTPNSCGKMESPAFCCPSEPSLCALPSPSHCPDGGYAF